VATNIRFVFFAASRSTSESVPFIVKYGLTGSRAEFLLGSFLVGLSLLGAWYTLKCRNQFLALEQDPVAVEGTVRKLWVTGSYKSRTYHLLCEYPVQTESGDRVLERERQLPATSFSRLAVGGQVTVTYCRTDPENHVVEGQFPPTFSTLGAVVAALVVLGILALIGCVNLWAWWATRRLLRQIPRTYGNARPCSQPG
jgi:hypothetical protein